MEQKNIYGVKQWLPELVPCQIDLTSPSVEHKYQEELINITENIHAWAISVLEEASLPITSNEINTLIDKYDVSTDEGCALHILLELSALRASIKNTDPGTAIIAGMKIIEALWQNNITNINKQENELREQESEIKDQNTRKNSIDEEDIALYQETIDELNKKYPHCSINALRLLTSTRLDVTKQELDELDISPQ